MEHSIKRIGKDYESLSIMRNDKNQFNSDLFFQYAKDNMDKYGIIQIGDDLYVGTWHCNSLINDYKLTI